MINPCLKQFSYMNYIANIFITVIDTPNMQQSSFINCKKALIVF